MKIYVPTYILAYLCQNLTLDMKLLYNYLKRYKWLVLLALVLAAINQIFSLIDTYIFSRIVDDFATTPHLKTEHHDVLSRYQFVKGVGLLILLGMGVAMVSRIAKNFQDYFVNVITQKLGAQIYSDGISIHLSCRIRYLKINEAERPWANYKKYEVMWKR